MYPNYEARLPPPTTPVNRNPPPPSGEAHSRALHQSAWLKESPVGPRDMLKKYRADRDASCSETSRTLVAFRPVGGRLRKSLNLQIFLYRILYSRDFSL